MTSEPFRVTSGWRRPYTAKRWHIFRDGASLCGRWIEDKTDQSDKRPNHDGTYHDGDCWACFQYAYNGYQAPYRPYKRKK